MSDPPIASIESHFSELPDPRTDTHRIRHKLTDMVVIASVRLSVVPIAG